MLDLTHLLLVFSFSFGDIKCGNTCLRRAAPRFLKITCYQMNNNNVHGTETTFLSCDVLQTWQMFFLSFKPIKRNICAELTRIEQTFIFFRRIPWIAIFGSLGSTDVWPSPATTRKLQHSAYRCWPRYGNRTPTSTMESSHICTPLLPQTNS